MRNKILVWRKIWKEYLKIKATIKKAVKVKQLKVKSVINLAFIFLNSSFSGF